MPNATELEKFVSKESYNYTNPDIERAAKNQMLLNQYIIMDALHSLLSPDADRFDHKGHNPAEIVNALQTAMNGTECLIDEMESTANPD